MKLRAQSANVLKSQFYDLVNLAYDNDTTLSISTAVYVAKAYKAGLPPVGTFSWAYQPVLGLQTLSGLFTVSLPASAIGPGPNSPGCVFPLTLVTIGIASDNVTVRFTDTVQAFSIPDNS